MPTSPNEALARDIIPAQKGNVQGPISPVHRNSWWLWGGASFTTVLLALFAQPLLSLIRYAAGSQLHSYILLVPFVSGYLLYLRRDRLLNTYTSDLSVAAVFLATGLGALLFAYRWNFAPSVPAGNGYLVLMTCSFLCFVAAGGFFFLGRDWMRAAAFPLAYLIFVVPMPDAMTEALEMASKSAAAEVANLLFHFTGTPFLRAGPIFQLPNITIEVAQQCSGIRSSLVLLLTSILAANLFLKTPWRRFALVAFVIPLGILRNGFRIVVIGLLCVNIGPEMIHSLIHRRGGPLFFMLSLIPFFVVLWWLRRGDCCALQSGRSE